MADQDAINALRVEQLRRDQQAGNGARLAEVRLQYLSTGVGDVLTPAVLFGATYLDQPHVSTGVVLERTWTSGPSIGNAYDSLYRLPQVTAGVRRWITEPGPLAGSVLYVGAVLFLSVHVQPQQPPRTDGANLESLLAAASAQTSGVAYADAVAKLAEARAARELLDNPPQVRLTHHLTFAAVAVTAPSLADNPVLQELLR